MLVMRTSNSVRAEARHRPLPCRHPGDDALKPQKAIDHDITLQIVTKLALHIGGQALGIGVGVERGEKGLGMVRDHLVEHRPARITWFVGGNSRSHACTLRTTSR